MSGSKTRPGFSGGDEPPPSDPEVGLSPRAARTMIGHDIHLRAPPDPRPAARVPPTPRQEALAGAPETPREEALAGVPEPVTDETTEELPRRPSHSGKSGFPALARLFGRWTTGGRFLSRSRMSGIDDDPLAVPREAWVSRVAIFVLAALLSFLAALVLLKLHRCSTTASRPSAATQVSLSPPPPAPPAASAAPAPSAPPSPPAAPSHLPGATAPVASSAQPPAVRPQATHRPATRLGGPSARAAPGATGKLRTQRTRGDRLTPTTGEENRDALLPLGM